MSEHERQEFLAGVHVGVISIERADGPPLTVPIWYGYEPGGLVWIITVSLLSVATAVLSESRRVPTIFLVPRGLVQHRGSAPCRDGDRRVNPRGPASARDPPIDPRDGTRLPARSSRRRRVAAGPSRPALT
jgi:hypothetical protein